MFFKHSLSSAANKNGLNFESRGSITNGDGINEVFL